MERNLTLHLFENLLVYIIAMRLINCTHIININSWEYLKVVEIFERIMQRFRLQ